MSKSNLISAWKLLFRLPPVEKRKFPRWFAGDYSQYRIERNLTYVSYLEYRTGALIGFIVGCLFLLSAIFHVRIFLPFFTIDCPQDNFVVYAGENYSLSAAPILFFTSLYYSIVLLLNRPTTLEMMTDLQDIPHRSSGFWAEYVQFIVVSLMAYVCAKYGSFAFLLMALSVFSYHAKALSYFSNSYIALVALIFPVSILSAGVVQFLSGGLFYLLYYLPRYYFEKKKMDGCAEKKSLGNQQSTTQVFVTLLDESTDGNKNRAGTVGKSNSE